MKQLQGAFGGRPRAVDDLLTLQKELTDAMQAQFLGRGPFILSGCVVSGPATAATVTAGILCLDGQLLRFAGKSGVALPAQFQTSSVVVESDLRPYQTGGSKYCMREVPAVLVASDPTYTGGEFLPLDTWGGKTWAHVQRALVRSANQVEWVAAANLNDYDNDGVGKPGTEAWGWALADGQNGRVDLMGRTAVGLNSTNPDYDAVGRQGGRETVALTPDQNGPHTHGTNGQTFGSSVTFDGGSSGAQAANFGNKSTATINQSGSGSPHENRMPFTTLLARVWVGY